MIEGLGEFQVKLIYKNDNDTIRTYNAYSGDTSIGDCQINLYENCLTIFSINIYEKYQRKGFGKKLVYKIENVAKKLGYDIMIIEWSQENENYVAPRKLALSCGFMEMSKVDYDKSGYRPIKNSINYVKYIN